MPDNNDIDFDSLFIDDDNIKDDIIDDDLFSQHEPGSGTHVEKHAVDEKEAEIIFEQPVDIEENLSNDPEIHEEIKKRTSRDFEPDMDAILITAQSPMIIEGMKYMTLKDFSSRRHQVYAEAIKGIDLFIKIIERNPNNYHKLAAIINTDIDCKEVEKTAFNLYKIKCSELPENDLQKLHSFQIFREKLKTAYKKTLISSTMVHLKKYYLMSGGLDQEKLNRLVKDNDPGIKDEINKIGQHVQIAVELLKGNDFEIAKGMKGKDANIFIIKSSQLLYYYYTITHNKDASDYYRRLYNTYKKYFIVK